jgi:exopolysaccharide biosynthesis polyprenyl glycosylphosphotransferase
MIRQHIALLKVALMVADGAVAFVLVAVVASLRFDHLDPGATWGLTSVDPLQLAVAYSVMWVAAQWLVGLYRIRTHWSLRAEIPRIMRATVLVALASVIALFLLRLTDVSRLFLVMLWSAQPLVTVASRYGLRLLLGWLRERGHYRREIVMVGAGPDAEAFADAVEGHPELGLRVTGHLSAPNDGTPQRRRPVIGSIQDLGEVLRTRVVDEIAICLTAADRALVEPVARICQEEGRIVRIPAALLTGASGADQSLERGNAEELGDVPILTFLYGPDRVLGMAVKRGLDIILSVGALVLLSPLIGGIAVYIRLKEGSPILFRQDRVGLHGRVFQCLKFRTMIRDADERFAEVAGFSEVRGPAFKMTDDPRVTTTGRVLRKTSLDELPQLINVLRGEMSLVGPRPALTREVAIYDVWHRRRLSMRPGITGLWQVEARRDDDFDRRASLDLHYIDRWSLWMDFKILLRTIPAVLMLEGR